MEGSSHQWVQRRGCYEVRKKDTTHSSILIVCCMSIGPEYYNFHTVDLVPPVFVWVGCANTIFQRKHSRWSLRSVAALFRDQKHGDDPGDGSMYSFYSRVALVQSAMDNGHSWHFFAVKERMNQVERDVSYHYMGSSIASRGRPSSRIMNDVFEEFCEHSTAK
jgi:hypothetical protein